MERAARSTPRLKIALESSLQSKIGGVAPYLSTFVVMAPQETARTASFRMLS